MKFFFSVRDRFAIAALAYFFTYWRDDKLTTEQVCEHAYAFADAMLEARKK